MALLISLSHCWVKEESGGGQVWGVAAWPVPPVMIQELFESVIRAPHPSHAASPLLGAPGSRGGSAGWAAERDPTVLLAAVPVQQSPTQGKVLGHCGGCCPLHLSLNGLEALETHMPLTPISRPIPLPSSAGGGEKRPSRPGPSASFHTPAGSASTPQLGQAEWTRTVLGVRLFIQRPCGGEKSGHLSSIISVGKRP